MKPKLELTLLEELAPLRQQVEVSPEEAE